MNWSRRLGIRIQRQDWFQRLFGSMLVGYYRFVVWTSRTTLDPADYDTSISSLRPFVMALWHGESLLVPFPIPITWPTKAMTSRSRDGGIVATILQAVGIDPIRASGGRAKGKQSRRGGVAGMLQARDAIRQGHIVCMTADIPKGVPYEVGPGIIALARHAGCAIVPVAVVSSNHIRMRTWDRMAVALPFGRVHGMFGTPITVPEGADDAALEAARLALETELKRIHALAYARVGHPTQGSGT
jgi:lysophospholipid acyltransferase (LPLAT)-like uncharacterized protein